MRSPHEVGRRRRRRPLRYTSLLVHLNAQVAFSRSTVRLIENFLDEITWARVVDNQNDVAGTSNLTKKSRSSARSGGNFLKDWSRHLLIAKETVGNTAFGGWASIDARSEEGEVDAHVEAMVASVEDVVHPGLGANSGITCLHKAIDPVGWVQQASYAAFLSLAGEVWILHVYSEILRRTAGSTGAPVGLLGVVSLHTAEG